MVQYVSGGKWGQILRRPLEAMTRTIWVLIVMTAAGAAADEASVPVGGVSECVGNAVGL